VKLVAAIKLKPTREQAAVLRATLKRCNEACTAIAAKGFAAGILRQFDLHKLTYVETRTEFGLTAQAAVRCISKVADAFKINRTVAPVFRADAAQPYDDRILSFKGEDVVSIWTLEGRMRIKFVAGQKQRDLLAFRKGEVDLCFVRGKWLLAATCDIPETEEFKASDWIGVDLGIVNIAATSDGKVYTGADIERVRARHAKRRKVLQSVGSKAAKRRLVKLSGQQARFQKHTNHCISKAIVLDAERTGRGIGVEELTHIREQVTARRKQRARLGNWSFGQLRAFLAYKAKRAGVPMVAVDPRNTSKGCSACGCIDTKNRPNQATFSCVSCGHSEPADLNAARNIRSRASATVTTRESSQACAA
jgi:IS605 OrfB family transposase